MQNKKNLWIVLVVLLVLIVLGFYLKQIGDKSEYSVVYLRTGEVYIGKLTTFPSLELKDAYIYQIAKDPNDSNKTNFQLQPVKEALWAPNSLHLIKENVIFYGPLSQGSSVAKTLAGQK